MTVVTVDDAKFMDLVPADADPNPLLEVDTFQRQVLGTSVFGERIDPNDERMKSEHVLKVKSLGRYILTFKYDGGEQLQIRAHPDSNYPDKCSSCLGSRSCTVYPDL